MILNNICVVVVKNFCYYFGDICVLWCIDVFECYYFVDCIVFLIEGKRFYFDEIVGSDFDGDKYFVCWDNEFVLDKEEEFC